MLTILTLAVIAAFVAFVVYPTYFGDVKGDHVNGVNAMIYVQDQERVDEEKAIARKAAIERAFAPA